MLYEKADSGKLSGRSGGNVYMRNGRVRSMTVPALVRNVYTGASRGTLSSFSSAWNALTDLERGSWLGATGNFRSNRFGHPIEIKGKELFVAFNTNLRFISQPQQNAYLSTIVTPDANLTLTGAASVGGGTMTVIYTATPLVIDASAILFATAQFSAGTYRPSQSAYRYIGFVNGGTASPYNAFAAYTSKFGSLTLGGKIFLRTIMVNQTLGKPSAPQDGSFIVAA